ncbi:MAG TPA: TCR/Tet family MFS transporter [Candidatus Eisenbacteria bacterium]
MSAPRPPATRPAATGRSAAVTFIFITVVIDILALGIIIPVLPRLVEGFLGGDTARAARMYGLFGTLWALMQFVFSPILGSLSDRFGRRPVILLSCLGLGLDYVFMALAPSVGWLLAGRIISGITAASIATAYAYIADVTPPEKRAASFGMIGAAWGLGFVLGPAVGGLLGAVNPRFPFWAAAALAFLNVIYGLFVLPESLPPESRRPFDWRRANPVGSLGLLGQHAGLLGLATVNLLYYIAHQVLPSVFVLYAGYRYGWDPRMVGFTLAVVGVCNVIVQAVLVKRVVGRFGARTTLLVGLVCGAIGFASYGLAPTAALFFLGVPIFAMMGFYSPAAQSIMSRRVSASEQGRLQGANASIMGLSGLVGPGLFTQVFAAFIGEQAGWHLPGAAFLLASILMFIAVPVALAATRKPTT